jgi:DNA-directed RNA polymerase specialized sigma24 family protein
MDEQLWTATVFRLARPRAKLGARVIGRRHRRAQWSPDEAARELHARRAELVAQARRRAETRGVPLGAIDEIVSDAITAVVMSPRSIANEHHLIGAFWLAVDHRCRRYREGRTFARLGSRQRVELDLALTRAPASDNPFDRLDASDRLARAADLMADLDARERRVVATMASRGVGPVSAARLLGLSLGEVRSAARSATLKLDRIAVISAAGRMCEFRSPAVVADAEGRATDHQVRLARAHIGACVPCASAYRQIRREMRTREFQRAAAAAFVPMPFIASGHGGVGRIAVWLEERIGALPHGSGERAVEVIAGGGAAKAAAAGTAVLLAGGALARPIVNVVESGSSRPAHHPHASIRSAEAASAHINTSAPVGLARVHVPVPKKATTSSDRQQRRTGLPTPPSRSLGYLALGGPSATATRHGSTATVARAASVSTFPAAEPVVPSKSGGGTGLQYLGR